MNLWEKTRMEMFFDANTIYQTDYTKKPMPKEDENIDLYLYNKYVKANQ